MTAAALGAAHWLRSTGPEATCRYADWKTPQALPGMSSDKALRAPTVLALGADPIVIGTAVPAWPIRRWSERLPERPIVILSSGGDRLAPPPGEWFLEPTAVSDRSGRIHLLWGEPGTRALATPVSLRSYQSLLVESIWYAVYDPRHGWSRATEVYRFPPSRLTRVVSRDGWHGRTPVVSDSEGRLSIAFTERGRERAVVLLHGDGERWTVHRLPAMTSSYVDLAAGVDGRLYLAYAGWRSKTPGPPRDVLVAHSDDGGSTWSTPVAVTEEGGEPVFEPRVRVATDGAVNVLWRTPVPGKTGTGAIHIVSSRNGGTLWSDTQSLAVMGEGVFDLELKAVVDRCGATHVAYQSPSGVRYARFDGAWSRTRRLFTAMRTRDVALALGETGEVDMVWSNFSSSSPRDSLVHFQHLRSTLSVQSNGLVR
jgi:hypothetical protein